MRDLSEIDLWQESLQRSLARRGRLPRSSPELARLQPTRDLSDEEFMSEYAQYWRMRREAKARRPLMPLVGVGGISSIALLAATLPSLLGGRSAPARSARIAYVDQAARPIASAIDAPRRVALSPVSHLTAHPRLVSVRPRPVAHSTRATTTQPVSHPAVETRPERTAKPARPRPAPAHHRSHPAPAAAVARAPKAIRQHAAPAHPTTKPVSEHTSQAATGSGGSGSHTTTSAVTSGGYVNPLARASVTPERIDQGVDYSASGTITAIGSGQVTYVGTSGTGWPGAFIEFRLSGGSDPGRYVYYAEGVAPVQGLHVGERVNAGQAIATMSGEIEIGWGAGVGTETYAMQAGQWNSGMDAGNAPTAAGKSFSALIASLGGPPGKIEG